MPRLFKATVDVFAGLAAILLVLLVARCATVPSTSSPIGGGVARQGAGSSGDGGATGVHDERSQSAESANAQGAAAVDNDAAFKVIAIEQTFSFDEQGLVTTGYEEVYEILSDAPTEGMASVRAAYNPAFEARPVIDAEVTYTGHAGVTHLDPSTIVEGPAETSANAFSDARQVQAPIPSLRRGAIVKRRVLRRETRLKLQGSGTLIGRAIGGFSPVERLRIVASAPEKLGLRVATMGLKTPIEPTRRVVDGREELVFEWEHLAAWEEVESYAPYEDNPRPFLWLSTGKRWNDVAKAYAAIAKRKLESGQTADAKARSLTGGLKTRAEKMTALLTWLRRHVRYTAMDLGTGTIIPRSPDETIKRGYGDCKDMSVLLVRMLKSIDIDAELVLLSVGEPDIPLDLPGFGWFDHAIVRVAGVTPNNPVFIDPTFLEARVGELPRMDQDRWGLIVNEATQALVKTPAPTSKDATAQLAFDIYVAEAGPSRIVRTHTSLGLVNSGRELAMQNMGKYVEETTQRFKEIYDATTLDVQASEPWALDEPFVETIDLVTRNIRTEKTRAVVPIAREMILMELAFSIDEDADQGRQQDQDQDQDQADARDGKTFGRKARLVFPVPNRHVVTWRVHAPPGFDFGPLPSSKTETFGPLTAKRVFTKEPGLATISVEIDTGARIYSAEEVELAKKGLRAVLAEVPESLRLDNQIVALIEKNKVSDALKLAQRLVREHPTSAPLHVSLANAYMKARAMRRALASANRALELDPKLVSAQYAMAEVLARNEVGELFVPGAQHQAALRFARKAYALDPKDTDSIWLLSSLYQYNDAWVWHGAGAELDKALSLYEDFHNGSGTEHGSYDHGYAKLLFELGKYERLVQLAPELADTKERYGYTVAATAITKDPRAAWREAQVVITDRKNLGEVIGLAYKHLIGAKAYAASAVLLVELARSFGTEARVAPIVKMLEKTKPIEPVDSPSDPRSLLIEFLRGLATNSEPDKFASMFEPKMSRGDVLTIRKALSGYSGVLKAALGVSSFDPVADILMGGCTWTTESVAVGTVVRCANPIQGQTTKLLVVKRKGKLKIHQASFDTGWFGKEALAQLTRKNQKGAIRWLEAMKQYNGSLDASTNAFFKRRLAGREELEVAAAAISLMTSDSRTPAALKTVTAALAHEADRAQREALRSVLRKAHETAKDGRGLLELAEDYRASKDLGAAAELSYRGNMLLKQFSAAYEIAQSQLAEGGDEATWMALAANASAKMGRLKAARAIFGDLRKLNGDNAFVLGAWAMWSLPEKVDADALVAAEQAVELSQRKDPDLLGTLAVLYAEVGRVDDALLSLEQMRQAETGPFGDGAIARWYAMGRIAEGLGLADEAIAYYQHVKPQEDGPALDLTPMAKKRISILESKR
ncbi:MAG: DUF3857 domain-containing protein [Deltaproteobacteria bacterium]|nr:DUF3857 domain-containing protein [Deltaproteobacteria bacterium]